MGNWIVFTTVGPILVSMTGGKVFTTTVVSTEVNEAVVPKLSVKVAISKIGGGSDITGSDSSTAISSP